MSDKQVQKINDLDNEKALSLYNILFQRVFEPFARYRVVCNRQGRNCDVEFIDVNPAYERIMGIKRQDIVGKRFREVWPHAEDYWFDIIIDTVKSGRSNRCEGISVDADKYLEAMAFPTFPDEVAVIFLDRTRWKKSDDELRRSEKALLEYREELRELAAKLSLAEADARRRIAERIHDTLGYSLVELLNGIRKLETANKDESIGESLLELAAMTEKTISESRDLTFATASPLLYDVGLSAAIEQIAETILTPHDIGFDFQEKNPQNKADTDISVLLFQMTRELLINVVKHSGADFVNLRVYRNPSKIRIVVEDNGKGFSKPLGKKWGQLDGFGLFSIRERLLTMGGNIRIYSEPGKGATICLDTPLKHPGQKEDARWKP